MYLERREQMNRKSFSIFLLCLVVHFCYRRADRIGNRIPILTSLGSDNPRTGYVTPS